MSASSVGTLGDLQTRMYKKWCRYAKSGDVTVFYRRSDHFGLGMKQMVPCVEDAASQVSSTEDLG